ncbi:MAG: histidine phosphatase family protein [Caldilineaceae bacterium]|nr:histidine phosphatase family protein [Caldilineaceae bacterium]
MKLFLIRHAQSTNNELAERVKLEEYMDQRSPEPPLTEAGHRQAQLVAEHLASTTYPESAQEAGNGQQGYGFSRLYCSPMLRTLQTTRPISQALGVQPQVWIDIHEHGGIFHGDPQKGPVTQCYGLTRQEIVDLYPDYQLPEGIAEKGWWPGGYEEMEGCYERAQRVAVQLREWGATLPDDRIALVAHGTFIDALLKAILGQDFAGQLYYSHYNTAITRLDFTPRGFILLRYLNRTEHLTPDLITR